MPKAERLLALARERYQPRQATRWPYLMRGDERFRFEGPDRRRLMADLRAAWRAGFPGEAAPAARDLSAVADDLRRLAEQAEPDQAGPEDLAAELMAAHGISAVPHDRGLSMVTGLDDCPLPDAYVIPGAVPGHSGRHPSGQGRRRWVRPCRVGVAVPGRGVRRPGWRPTGRAGLARRSPVGVPADPPRGHQERPQARSRGRGCGPASHRGRSKAGRTLASRC